ncbi:MAG: phosphoribosylglycinamide formyltransferase, partial [Nitrospinae bacterium]|nr:phosphoribosylglycinamide formyltransferase [Nitrospinota bacterium]
MSDGTVGAGRPLSAVALASGRGSNFAALADAAG